MSPDLEKQLYIRAKDVFFPALDLPPAQWPEYLDEHCSGDNELRIEVESLLAVIDGARKYYDLPDKHLVEVHDPTEIGGYTIVEKLGTGGMGVVYLAERRLPHFIQRVAIKVARDPLGSGSVRKQFDLERLILSGLDHPNIARLIDGGTSPEGTPYFVMEFVDGTSLIKYADINAIDVPSRLRLFQEVCAAVAYAHRRAVIHRDLKPGNILVTKEGLIKLLDFGIAKLITAEDARDRTSTKVFTPEFASPEQFQGGRITTASDVYSLGVILYKLLTGVRPYNFEEQNWQKAVEAVCEVSPTKPSAMTGDKHLSRILKGDLDKIVLTSLRKEPERRYQSVDAFNADITSYLAGLPVAAMGDSLRYRFSKMIRRNPVATVMAFATLLIVLTGIGTILWESHRAEREKERAEKRFAEVRSLANSFMFELNDEIRKGPTPARELVVKRALEYLDRLASESNDDLSLRKELAAAYEKVGDIQGAPWAANLGKSAEALESYQKARLIIEELYNEDPKNPDNVKSVARIWHTIGVLQGARTLEYDKSVPLLEKARDLLHSLEDPSDSDVPVLLGDIYSTLGTAYVKREDKFDAYTKSLRIRQVLADVDPTDSKRWESLGVAHERLGIWYLNRSEREKDNIDDLTTASFHYDTARAIYQDKVRPAVSETQFKRLLASVDIKCIPIFAGNRQQNAMKKTYEDALRSYQSIADADPINYEARLNIAQSHYWMCRSLLKIGNAAGAVEMCGVALEAFEPLFASDPTNGAVYGYVMRICKAQSRAYNIVGDLNGSIAALERAFTYNEKWLLHGPSYHYSKYDGATTAYFLGDRYSDLALRTNSIVARNAAIMWYERAIPLFHQHTQQYSPKTDMSNTLAEIDEKLLKLRDQ